MGYNAVSYVPALFSLEVIDVTDKIGTLNSADFVERYLAGESLAALAVLAHCDFRTAKRRLVALGVKVRDKQAAAPQLGLDVSLVRSRYEAGESTFMLARSSGCSPGAIKDAILRAGGQIRTTQERNALRFSRMPDEERFLITRPFAQSRKGTRDPLERKNARARTNESRLNRVSPEEKVFLSMLINEGIAPRQQTAVGPYNLDFTIDSVAVEVFGGGWHAQAERLRQFEQRTRYLFEAGWHVYVVWVEARRWPLIDVSQDIIAFAKEGRSLPASRRRYRVIRGNGEVVSFGSSEDQSLTFVPSTRRS